MSTTDAFRAVKRLLLPSGSSYRRIPFGPASGCVISIDFHHHMRVFLGLYEAELLPYFRELVPRGANCFDVGGRDGYDALILAKRSGGRVVSVECDRGSAELMRETFRRNSYAIDVVERFVCDEAMGERITLDQLAAETFVPDFIKMDIEGAEADALRGARQLLSGRRPGFIIETHGQDVETECISILRDHNYRVQIVPQRTWLKELRPIAHNRWIVCRP